MIRPCRLISIRHVATEIAISFALLLCAANGAAQTSRVGASLEGTVSDSSGAKILQAVITLRNTLTTHSRNVTTDDQGFFRADQLAVGTYEIRLEHTYFAPYRRAGVTLSLGQNLHLDIVLYPASTSEQVTVSVQPLATDTSQTSLVSSVDQERIEELPVRSRDYLDFVLLAPDVSSSPAPSSISGSTPLTA